MKRLPVILLVAIFSARGFAMSKSPEPYTPPEWHENSNAQEDASYALDNDDMRLLAYTTRGITVPGIDDAEKDTISKQCGIRMLDGFGDVVRNEEQLRRMKAMHAYVSRYNAVIAKRCKAK